MAITPVEGQRVGNYLLTRKIAAGACGEVWLGRHHAWGDKLVAVKIPNDPQYVRNLQQDGAAIHGLRHPAIVEAVDFDPYADPPYLAMEYVPGSSLRALIQERKLGVPEAVAVLRHVLAALAHAHARGVLHRDIKPENILVHERAFQDGFLSEGVIKVTDFGLGRMQLSGDSIAVSTSVSLQDARHMVGTLAYMSPEQREGLPADARADLYACGVVFFEMLTGKKPHGADFPSKANASVPAHLNEAFRGAYAWLDDRYASAEDFSEALDEPAAPPPGLARQPEDHAAPAATPLPAGDRWRENSIGMEFVRIEPGTFMMGSPQGEAGRLTDETQHPVTLSKPYYIGTHHVTRGQFAAFAQDAGYQTDAERDGWAYTWRSGQGFDHVYGASWKAPGFHQTDTHPAVVISWNDAMAFCAWLAAKDRKPYRLPTEAQWEYACRAGTKTAYFWGDRHKGGDPFANFYGLAGKEKFKFTSPVGSFIPNPWGLYGMIGNACEWCSDVYWEYPARTVTNPLGTEQQNGKMATNRVVRGGSWSNSPGSGRSAYRESHAPGTHSSYFGFRVCFDL